MEEWPCFGSRAGAQERPFLWLNLNHGIKLIWPFRFGSGQALKSSHIIVGVSSNACCVINPLNPSKSQLFFSMGLFLIPHFLKKNFFAVRLFQPRHPRQPRHQINSEWCILCRKYREMKAQEINDERNRNDGSTISLLVSFLNACSLHRRDCQERGHTRAGLGFGWIPVWGML